MIELATKVFAAYLLGNVMGGSLIGRLRGGVDLRSVGSGNVGATNALRTQGKNFALLVLLVDVGKGVLAAGLLPLLPWPVLNAVEGSWSGASALPREALACACGAAAALGHCYPVFDGFRGGKGVATLAGVYATVLTAALPWLLLGFAAVLILTGYVSLATLMGAVIALFYVACISEAGIWSPLGAFALAMTLLVIWKHRENWSRLARGEEHRFDKARVLPRLLNKWLR